ncbi:AI-2E family transporter [Saccharopolyspora elongata]|uniref:AI-2E family transporter n=1 Tax=Saccharopolyspora elongata TaxID=2530387 RepID=A0A4R4YFI8_9PSEU|nr:AI-2E family transporter [Saccharopolyspora elongata]TDD43473.1 AI-2E family transporter [Saccharopolyspora elongata]
MSDAEVGGVPAGERPGLSLFDHAKIACVYLLVGVVAVLAYSARNMLILIFLGFFLALGVEPIIAWLHRHGWRRGLALLVLLLGAVLLIGALVLLALVPAVGQVGQLVSEIPELISGIAAKLSADPELQAKLNDPSVHEQLQQAMGAVTGVVTSTLAAGFAVIGTFFGGIFAACTAGALTVYFSLAMPRINAAVERGASAHEGRAEALRQAMGRVGGYVTGQAVVCLCAGIVSYLFFFFAGVPYPALLALVVALFDAVPQVGATLASVTGILVALSQSLTLAVVTLIFFCLYQMVENYLIAPRIFAKTVELSPLGAFVAILLGAALAGVLGALTALPIAAALKVLIRQFRAEHTTGVG